MDERKRSERPGFGRKVEEAVGQFASRAAAQVTDQFRAAEAHRRTDQRQDPDIEPQPKPVEPQPEPIDNQGDIQRVYRILTDAKPEAVVVYCSDPRFQQAFDAFIRDELKLEKGKFVPIVVGGGAGMFSLPMQLPKSFKFGKDSLEFFKEHFPSIKRVILINHEDCAYYHSLVGRFGFLAGIAGKLKEHQVKDLGVIAKTILSALSIPVGIELYYAEFADAEKDKAVFNRVI